MTVVLVWVLPSLWLGTAEGGVIAGPPAPARKKSNENVWLACVKSSGLVHQSYKHLTTNSSSIFPDSGHSIPWNPSHTWTLAHHRKRVRRTLRQHVACATWWKAWRWSFAPRRNFQDMPKASKCSKGMKGDVARVYDRIRLEVFLSFYVFMFSMFSVSNMRYSEISSRDNHVFSESLNSDEFRSVLWT